MELPLNTTPTVKQFGQKEESLTEKLKAIGTIKRSGHFENGEPVGEWITYDSTGKPYKVTKK